MVSMQLTGAEIEFHANETGANGKVEVAAWAQVSGERVYMDIGFVREGETDTAVTISLNGIDQIDALRRYCEWVVQYLAK